jgi:UDP-glucose 4-epimerase
VRDVVRYIGRAVDAEHLIDLGALPRQAGEPDVLVADVKRLATEVKWSPRYSLEAGLDDSISWWVRQHGARPALARP